MRSLDVESLGVLIAFKVELINVSTRNNKINENKKS